MAQRDNLLCNFHFNRVWRELAIAVFESEGDGTDQFEPLLHKLHGVPGALRYNIPLPLGDGGQDVHHHTAVGGGSVKVVLQAGKGNAVAAKYVLDQIAQILDRTGQPVQL